MAAAYFKGRGVEKVPSYRITQHQNINAGDTPLLAASESHVTSAVDNVTCYVAPQNLELAIYWFEKEVFLDDNFFAMSL